jgi:hypothetical protein
MTVETDRRGKFRKRPSTLVYVELASGNGGMMRDLCEEGFALRAMMPLRPGETTTFNFSLDAGSRIEGEGRLIWVEENGKVAGLEFTQISPESLGRIRAWLENSEEAATREAEVPVKPASATNPIMDQLRHEARTVSSRPPAHKGDVTVFRSPAKAEPKPEASSSRPIPSPEQLKREIAEALRQAAEERLEKEGPSVHAASAPPAKPEPPPIPPPVPPAPIVATPPPPVIPPPAAAPIPPPAAVAESPNSPPPPLQSARPHIEAPVWVHPVAAFEPLPAIEDMDFGRRIRPGFTLSRAIGILVLIALGVAGYVYRQEVGQFMIQTGQKISGPAESANSGPVMPMPRSSSPTDAASTNQGNTGQPNRAEASPSTIPLPGSSVPTSSSSGSSAAGGAGSASPLTTGPESTTPRSGDAGSMATPSYVSPGRKNSSTAVPVSPLMTGGNPNAVGDPSSESGQTEYLQAVQILRSKKSREDQADAARLLWIAVEKGNSNAEVALAELYRLGQGVGQNCDQARVLLTAAARKGNPEGVRHLQLFEQAGCE